MKIVHIITDLNQGGAETALLKLITASRALTPEVEHQVISLRSIGTVGPKIAELDVALEALGIDTGLQTLRAIPRLVAMLRAQSKDTTVQTWMYHADLFGGLCAKIAGISSIFWNVRSSVDKSGMKRSTFFILRTCAALSRIIPNRIINCGQVSLNSHVAIGYDLGRCVVIGNGFDTATFAPQPDTRARLRAELGFGQEDLVIGTVARMHPQKDFDTLARAAAAVARAVPQARFLWVGRGIDTDPGLDQTIRALGIADRVVRPGMRQDIPELLSAMDAHCLSSRVEGFPNALGEAMACALPCVATDAGDSALLFGDSDWITPVREPDSLAAALIRLLTLPAESRRELGRRNRERIITHYSIDQAWLRYFALYSNGAGHGSGGGDLPGARDATRTPGGH